MKTTKWASHKRAAKDITAKAPTPEIAAPCQRTEWSLIRLILLALAMAFGSICPLVLLTG